MRPEQKTKSRTKLYNAIEGANSIVGAAGVGAIGDIVFTDIPLAGEQVVIGGYVFEAQAGASEAGGTSAGTAADPHLFQAITDLATAGASLAAQVIAETATTGRWGYLNPVNAVGCDFTTDTLTLTFWPGTWANGITFSGTGDITSTTTAAGGVDAPTLSSDYSVNLIDTTGSAQNKEYYHMVDGQKEGQVCKVAIKAAGGSDTPTIIGKLSDTGTSSVEALFATNEPGMYASFMWIAGEWHLLEEGFGTALTFDAAT